jgi:hypothetical protein
VSLTDANLDNAITNGTYWAGLLPVIGTAYQKLSVNSSGTGLQYSYDQVNPQALPASDTIPAGYNLMTGNVTVGSGLSLIAQGSINCAQKLQATGTGVIQATGTGTIRVF